MLAYARMISTWRSPNILASQDVWPPTVLARPGNPIDPKSHFLVTKWVAVASFGTWGPGTHAEFRRESRQGGPAPSISIFFHHLERTKYQNVNVCVFFENGLPHRGGFGAPWAPCGPNGPWGPYGGPTSLHARMFGANLPIQHPGLSCSLREGRLQSEHQNP